MILELPRNLPVGFRFHPTEEELIKCYLRPKILGTHFDDAIAELDICDWEPWELPGKSKIKSNDRMWWFLCRRDYKNTSNRRSKRTTKTGFWKITGQERKIKDQDTRVCIGKKKTLVFYTGPTPGKRTNWVMQEFYLEPAQENASYVICRLKMKTDENVNSPDYDGGVPSGEIITPLENPRSPSAIQWVPDYDGGVPSCEIITPFENPRSPSAVQWLNDQTDAIRGSSLQLLDPLDGHLTAEDIQMMLSDDFTVEDELQMAIYESEESPEEFVEGLFADPDENYCGETSNNVVKYCSQQTSSKRSYFRDAPAGSDTDAEGANGQFVLTLESSSSLNSPFGSKRARPMRMVKAPSKPLQTVVTVAGQLSRTDASSTNLTKPLEERNFMSAVSEVKIPQHVGVSRGGQLKRVQIQKNHSSAAVSSNKATEDSKRAITTNDPSRKDMPIRESQKARNVVETIHVEKELKSASFESPATNWKSLYTFVESSPVSRCNSCSPSHYWINAIVGTALFVVFIRELVVFGSW